MVRAKDVDNKLKPPSKFFPMIRDIRQPVGRLPRPLDDNAVLLQANSRRFEPDRSFTIVSQSTRSKFFNNLLYFARRIQRVFIVENVMANAQTRQCLRDFVKTPCFRFFLEVRSFGISFSQRIPLLSFNFQGNLY